MRQISIIYRRELAAYLTSAVGVVVAALVLLVVGLVFQAMAMSAGKRLSAQVLSQFFFYASGTLSIAAVVLSIRLFAEERQSSSIVLLNTSPIRDVEIVLGKYFAAFTFLSLITLSTLYMPLLILVNGKVSMAQIAVGYLGLLLLGGAVLSVGLFTTALTRHQLVAWVLAAVLVGALYMLWPLSQVVEAPFKTVFAAMAIHARHFQGFQSGVLHLRDVVYYVSLTVFFLTLTVKVLEAKRWQ